MQTRALGIGCLAVSILAWLAIGVAMVIDVTHPEPETTPTLAPAATLVAVVSSEVSSPTAVPLPTGTPTEPDTVTPIPPTVTPLVAIADTAHPSPLTPLPQAGEANSTTQATQAATVSATGTGSTCTPPAGWIPYHVADGDTLFGFVLGSGNTITVEQIMQANCLHDRGALSVGQVIYLPPGVAAKAPKIDDGPPGGTLLPVGLTRTADCPCSITVHSGWRLEQVASRIDAIPVGFTGRDFLSVTAPGAPTDGFGFLSGKPASASFEGFMYPGDYTLSNSTTALQFRDMLLHQFDQAIPQQWRNDANAHGGLYSVVVFASIVQRESSTPDDQAKVASVMYNRMAANKGIAADPTVQYIFGHPGAWWPTIGAAELKSQSRYNTYVWLGLPPAPISNPDANAVHASIYPAQTDYQYFSANCNGPGNMYATTWDQFDAMLKACP